ncbi:MAG: site-specific integrase, partial [Candidatus Thiodiazotropha endolucinida]
DYGIMTGKARVNPVTPLRGVVEKRPVQHRKALGREQLPDFLRKLEAATNINAVTKAAAWLQVLTFLRPGELRHGLWDEIKWQKREWHIPQSRTHPYTGENMLGMKMREPHVVPLSDQVLSILKDLKRLTGERAFIFPGHHDYRKPLSEGAVLASIKKRLGYPVTAHGFRAVARTVLDEELGFRADYIEHQLHHAVRDPNGRAYNRTTYLKQRHEMMQTWADFIFNLKDSANVVAIRKAR